MLFFQICRFVVLFASKEPGRRREREINEVLRGQVTDNEAAKKFLAEEA